MMHSTDWENYKGNVCQCDLLTYLVNYDFLFITLPFVYVSFSQFETLVNSKESSTNKLIVMVNTWCGCNPRFVWYCESDRLVNIEMAPSEFARQCLWDCQSSVICALCWQFVLCFQTKKVPRNLSAITKVMCCVALRRVASRRVALRVCHSLTVQINR